MDESVACRCSLFRFAERLVRRTVGVACTRTKTWLRAWCVPRHCIWPKPYLAGPKARYEREQLNFFTMWAWVSINSCLAASDMLEIRPGWVSSDKEADRHLLLDSSRCVRTEWIGEGGGGMDRKIPEAVLSLVK